MCADGRSSRAGWESTSSAVPVLAQAANSSGRSTSTIAPCEVNDTTAPSSSSMRRSLGMATISLDFSATLT